MSELWHYLATPGTDLAKEGAVSGAAALGQALLAAWPEVFGIAAMCCLLIGMTGSRKFMGYAGTCTLLVFVGVLLNAAI